ncbi:ParA family protein [Synechococcus sp. H55.7]|uniref:ParA family protein n=1 Tax=unclassified Synechococcus TaxID=2626047 RepID=UPI0039C12945
MNIAVLGFKGGVGKTTTAVHLALYLQQRCAAQASTPQVSLLLDADPNRSASRWAERGSPFPVKVLAGDPTMSTPGGFQHTLIDTPARPTPEQLSLLAERCELLLLPCSPDALALDALMLTVNALDRLGAKHYKVLLTLVPPWPNRDGAEARSFLQKTGIPLCHHSIRRTVAFQRAALEGVCVNQLPDPRAKQAWSDYVAVGEEILS